MDGLTIGDEAIDTTDGDRVLLEGPGIYPGDIATKCLESDKPGRVGVMADISANNLARLETQAMEELRTQIKEDREQDEKQAGPTSTDIDTAEKLEGLVGEAKVAMEMRLRRLEVQKMQEEMQTKLELRMAKDRQVAHIELRYKELQDQAKGRKMDAEADKRANQLWRDVTLSVQEARDGLMVDFGALIKYMLSEVFENTRRNERVWLEELANESNPEHRGWLVLAKKRCDKAEVDTVPRSLGALCNCVAGLRDMLQQHEKVWAAVPDPEGTLRDHLTVTVPKGPKPRQPDNCRRLDALVKFCWTFTEPFNETLKELLKTLNGAGIMCELMTAPMKGAGRCVYKYLYVYKRDATLITDVLRCSFIFYDLASLYKAASYLAEAFNGVLRIKNRFVTPALAGYRDMLMNVQVEKDGPMAEVQFHLKPYIDIKKKSGHGFYKHVRHFGADSFKPFLL